MEGPSTKRRKSPPYISGYACPSRLFQQICENSRRNTQHRTTPQVTGHFPCRSRKRGHRARKAGKPFVSIHPELLRSVPPRFKTAHTCTIFPMTVTQKPQATGEGSPARLQKCTSVHYFSGERSSNPRLKLSKVAPSAQERYLYHFRIFSLRRGRLHKSGRFLQRTHQKGFKFLHSLHR